MGNKVEDGEISAIEILSLSGDSNWGNLTHAWALNHKARDHTLQGVVGALINDEIVICGGERSIGIGTDAIVKVFSECNVMDLETYSWGPAEVSLRSKRAFAKAAKMGNGTFIVTGGRNDTDEGAVESIEVLDDGDNFIVSPRRMPERMVDHCLAVVNESHLFISGGYYDEEHTEDVTDNNTLTHITMSTGKTQFLSMANCN